MIHCVEVTNINEIYSKQYCCTIEYNFMQF